MMRGIGEERVLAFEDVVVGAADADMADGDQRPAGRWRAGAARSSRTSSPGERQTTAFMLQSSFNDIAGPAIAVGPAVLWAVYLPRRRSWSK